MSNKQLEIILRLRDEFTKELQNTQENIRRFVNETGRSFTDFGKQVNKIGTNLTFLGAAITGPLALAFKTSANYSIEASNAMQRMEQSAARLQIVLGTAVTPVMEKASSWISGLVSWFERMDPQVRDSAIQFLLLGGAFVTAGGLALKLIGHISTLIGTIIKFSAAHPVLMITVGALALMVMQWQNVRAVAIPVMNALEIGANLVAIGFQKMVGFMADSLAFVTSGLEKVLEYLSYIPGPQQRLFQSMRDGAQGTVEFFQQISEASKMTVSDLEDNIRRIMESGQGGVSSFVDNSIASIQQIWDFLKNPPVEEFRTSMQAFEDTAKAVFVKASEDAGNVGKNFATIVVSEAKNMSSKFGDAFGQMIVYGKNFSQSMKDAMKQLAADFIAKLTSMVVDWVALKVMGDALMSATVGLSVAMAGAVASAWAAAAAMVSLATFGANAGPASAAIAQTTALSQALAIISPVKKHSGGMIGTDEVPAILQTGEGVLSRRGMANLGGSGALNSLNSGVSAPKNSGSIINININNPSVRNDDDIKEIALKVSTIFAQEIDRI